MKYHYKVSYKFSKLFNTLWRIAFIMPAMLGILYYILNYQMNSPFPLWIVILASLSVISIVLLIRFLGYKEIKATDTYNFYITDKKVVSEYPSGSKHRLSYDIVVLSSYASSSPSYGVFKIKTKNGKTYEVSGNYINAGKVLKTIKSIRPDLTISHQLLQTSELNSLVTEGEI